MTNPFQGAKAIGKAKAKKPRSFAELTFKRLLERRKFYEGSANASK